MRESVFLAFLLKHNKPAFYKVARFGMDKATFLSPFKIFDRVIFVVIFALINFARRHSVAKHFRNISHRHFHGTHLLFNRIIVCPVFKMVSVPSFVMQPRFAVALLVSFGFIRAVSAAVILYPLPKFNRRIL